MEATNIQLTLLLATLTLGLLGLLAFSIALGLKAVTKKGIDAKLKMGLIICFLTSGICFGFLANLNWTIPECYNAQGSLIEHNPKCQFP